MALSGDDLVRSMVAVSSKCLPVTLFPFHLATFTQFQLFRVYAFSERLSSFEIKPKIDQRENKLDNNGVVKQQRTCCFLLECPSMEWLTLTFVLVIRTFSFTNSDSPAEPPVFIRLRIVPGLAINDEGTRKIATKRKDSPTKER